MASFRFNCRIMDISNIVSICTQNEQYNAMLWSVVAVDEEAAKLVLQSVSDSTKRIKVCKQKCNPTTVNIPSQIPIAEQAQAVHLCVDKYLDQPGFQGPDMDQYLNRWVPLPLRGGNSMMLCRRPAGEPNGQLILFPRLNRRAREIWFHSQWYGHVFKLMVRDADDLGPCEQEQMCPICTWCQKFHLPHTGPNSHRSSKKHLKFLEHAASWNQEDLRLQCRQWCSRPLFL